MTGQRIILGIAAFWGLAGVVLLAMGSHPPAATILATGGSFLLFHAAAVLAVNNSAVLAGWRRAAPVALMLTGSGIFGLETLIHGTTGILAFQMFAPLGGGLAILGWLVLAIGAFLPDRATG
jgi:uncharacterized membrane protein YgdD (TMEM256/DUF423 family)